MSDDDKARAAHAIVARHLQHASALERHVYVARSNYDDNLPHLGWLADQPKLDLATAVMMFWCLGGRWQAGFAADSPEAQQDKWQLCQRLQQRCVQGFYAQGAIHFDPGQDSPVSPDEYNDVPLLTPIAPLMYEVVPGAEAVDVWDDDIDENFDDGLPMAVAEAIFALWEQPD